MQARKCPESKRRNGSVANCPVMSFRYGTGRSFRSLHDVQRPSFDCSVILVCVRWYLAFQPPQACCWQQETGGCDLHQSSRSVNDRYCAIDSTGETVDFWFSKHRDLPAAKRCLRKALEHSGERHRSLLTIARRLRFCKQIVSNRGEISRYETATDGDPSSNFAIYNRILARYWILWRM